MDLGFSGPCFTWEHDWENAWIIDERLDQAIAHASWMTKWPSTVVSQVRQLSSPFVCNGPRPFRLDSFWTKDPEFPNIVKEVWNDNIEGSYLLSWSRNLSVCSSHISSWSEKFSNKRTEINRLLKKIQENETQHDPIVNGLWLASRLNSWRLPGRMRSCIGVTDLISLG